MTFKELREKSGMSRSGFAKFFAIPYRTVQNWELGLRECPEYLLDLMKYKLEKENENKPQMPVEKFPFELCPRCERVVHKGLNYCPDCGLALDWSDSFVKIPQNFDGDLKKEVEKQLKEKKAIKKEGTAD